MTPKNLMICGALSGIAALIIGMTIDLDTSIQLLASGALFGKGYGVWEERSERKDKA